MRSKCLQKVGTRYTVFESSAQLLQHLNFSTFTQPDIGTMSMRVVRKDAKHYPQYNLVYGNTSSIEEKLSCLNFMDVLRF